MERGNECGVSNGFLTSPSANDALALTLRTGTEQECALRVVFEPFVKPPANARSLRKADSLHRGDFDFAAGPQRQPLKEALIIGPWKSP
jgi:hypothetical protein